MKHEARRSQKVQGSLKERKSKEQNEMTDEEFLEVLEELWPGVGEESDEEFERRLEKWLKDEEDLDEDGDYDEEDENE